MPETGVPNNQDPYAYPTVVHSVSWMYSRYAKIKSWDHVVQEVITVEGPTGPKSQGVVYIRPFDMQNGKQVSTEHVLVNVPLPTARYLFPQKLMQFYEDHLAWNQYEERIQHVHATS
ncbi:hypothetical protein PM082_024735 [Marasmius tenuissimus]|nr:hypothetical protein PM082_024735 [Marasmius tenuissimus]